MRFIIAAVAALGIMTIDFETSFKLNHDLHRMPRGAFTVAVAEEGKAQSTEHSIGTEDAASPAQTNGVSGVTEAAPQAEASEPTQDAPKPKKSFCDALKEAAEESGIPTAFFARLLWQESRFQYLEVSRAGARGVAQFMPGTAAEVGLDDPFDPFKALPASAKLLRKLHDEFGNLGLAAAAYNAGSGRIQKWLSGQSTLPQETRDYVRIITGNVAENWLEESKVLWLHLELPKDAACEGVGGLSKTKEVAAVPVALAPSTSDAIEKAEAETQRVTAARLKAAVNAKTRVVLLQKNKKTLKQLASTRAVRTQVASQSARGRSKRDARAVLAKSPARSRTKAAERSRQTNDT